VAATFRRRPPVQCEGNLCPVLMALATAAPEARTAATTALDAVLTVRRAGAYLASISVTRFFRACRSRGKTGAEPASRLASDGPAARELFDRIMQMTDNAGATGEQRARLGDNCVAADRPRGAVRVSPTAAGPGAVSNSAISCLRQIRL
jgi:hypothetical protein